MRLREIKSMLEDYQKNIDIESKPVSNSTEQWVFKLQESINNIEKLSILGFLDSDIKRLKSLGNQIYYARNKEDQIRVSNNTYKSIEQYIGIIKEKISGYIELIDHSIPKNRNNVINIKLPNYTKVKELEKFYGKLNDTLQTGLTIDEVKGSYKVQNFDSGSLWTEILLDNADTIIFFGGLLKLALEINKQSKDVKIAKLKLEELKLQGSVENSSMDEIFKQLDSELDKKIDAKLKQTQFKVGELSPESKNKIKLSIRTLSELLDEGTEFYPSSEEKSEIKQVFPEQLKQLNEPQKLLENNTKEEDN